MKERSIIMTGDSVRAILGGSKTQTRRVMKPQPEGEPATLHEWAEGLARVCRGQGTIVTDQMIEEKAAQLRGRIFPFRREHRPSLYSPQCPFGLIGHRLWVRESFAAWFGGEYTPWHKSTADWRRREFCTNLFYRATHHFPDDDQRWTSPIHMPRWASRLTLEITDVRVERLKEITGGDAIAEGCDPKATYGEASLWFMERWDTLNRKRGYPWSASPWVWVLTFRRLS